MRPWDSFWLRLGWDHSSFDFYLGLCFIGKGMLFCNTRNITPCRILEIANTLMSIPRYRELSAVTSVVYWGCHFEIVPKGHGNIY